MAPKSSPSAASRGNGGRGALPAPTPCVTLRAWRTAALRYVYVGFSTGGPRRRRGASCAIASRRTPLVCIGMTRPRLRLRTLRMVILRRDYRLLFRAFSRLVFLRSSGCGTCWGLPVAFLWPSLGRFLRVCMAFCVAVSTVHRRRSFLMGSSSAPLGCRLRRFPSMRLLRYRFRSPVGCLPAWTVLHPSSPSIRWCGDRRRVRHLPACSRLPSWIRRVVTRRYGTGSAAMRTRFGALSTLLWRF